MSITPEMNEYYAKMNEYYAEMNEYYAEGVG
jgi:hypothetical protein